MAQIEADIAATRLILASDSGNKAAKTRLVALMRELEALSASMGGDRPVAHQQESRMEEGRAEVGPPPPTCTTATTILANGVPVAIPTGPAVVTSTILVAGAGTFLWDVNVTTSITHTFAADLDITIQSPAGTVVTLTTDNGAGNDDVFNGTIWDDALNPGGQVPYTTNNGLATDHAYANLTVANPLAPEEALGAFYGEDPNGTWTLTISDDLAGDGGNLSSWGLNLTTLAGPPNHNGGSFSTSPALAIPTGPGVVTSTLLVSGAGTSLAYISLQTFITHSFSADLDITLQSPAGTVVTLTTDNGAGNDDVFNGTVWSNTANPGGQVPYTTNNGMATDHAYANLTVATPLAPEESFGAFQGEDPNGTWTLTISDDLAGDGGNLASWTLWVWDASCFVGPTYDLNFRDQYNRSELCLDSATGDYVYNVLSGPYTGQSFAGTANIVQYAPTLFLFNTPCPAGSTHCLSGNWNVTRHSASAILKSYLPSRFSSSLYDANYTDSPPCGGP
jgi:subtilisin-like proprotein convertase family protein